MINNEWNFLDNVDLEDTEYVERKKSVKQAKRRWREIENFKEQQRLNRDLEAFNSYN